MAQTQSHQLPPAGSQQSYSPPISTPPANSPSPAPGNPPPAKKPRLSPFPQIQQQSFQQQQAYTSQSFAASPSFGTLQLSRPATPVNGAPVNGTQNIQPNAPPPPPPPPGSMAPPPARADRATDAAELTDVLASSGIDVREEEAYLTQGYGQQPAQQQQQQQQQPQQPPRLQTTFSNSFPSQQSGGTITPGASFTSQPQQTTFQAYTPISQAPHMQQPPQRTAEQVAADNARRSDTYMSRRAQYHLQDPFLNTAAVENKLQFISDDKGLRLPTMGVFRPVPGQAPATVEVSGPDGSTKVSTGRTIMSHNATLGDMISLISLAFEERVRTVVDQSAAIAQNRQISARGIPDEWSDLAVVQKAEETVDGANGAATAGRKRSISEIDKPLPNPIAVVSAGIIDKDVAAEAKRAAKRARRNADAIVAGEATPGSATPVSMEPERRITKKELKKAEAKISDAVQHQQSIQTARMATSGLAGRFGGKKKNYSWLTSAAPTPSRPGGATPNRGNSTPGGGATSGAGAGASATTAAKVRGARLGEWSEADKQAAGIQVRDILLMLDVDGLAAKQLQRGYAKQMKEESDQPR